jgi:hypothetical protein
MKFHISTTLNDFYDVDLEVEADVYQQPSYVDGLPENCYPEESECIITSVKVLCGYGQQDEFLLSLVDDDWLTNKVWETFRDE